MTADASGDVVGVLQAQHGTVSLNSDGSLTYTAGASFTGSDSFQYEVSDGHGGAVTETVTVTAANTGASGRAHAHDGRVTETADGSYTYSAGQNFAGSDTFSLVVDKSAAAPSVTIENFALTARTGAQITSADSAVESALTAPGKQIAFVESNLPDLQTLLAAIPQGTEIVMLDAAKDGVDQMAQALEGQHGVTAIHILSHGSEANL